MFDWFRSLLRRSPEGTLPSLTPQVKPLPPLPPVPWANDLLHRKQDASLLLNYIQRLRNNWAKQNVQRSFVLNIDATWGEGKTYFLTQLSEQLKADDMLVAYVNAWEDDHAEDPLVPIIVALDQAIKIRFPASQEARDTWDTVKTAVPRVVVAFARGAIITAAKRMVGEDAQKEAVDAIGSITAEASTELANSYAQSILDRFADAKDAIETLKQSLLKFSYRAENTGLHLPIFILIDELDRCRPSYAVATLERLKHIFDVPNVVFVVATDTEQLQHTVSAIYGEHFAGARYLQRFFDRVYRFASPNLTAYFENRIANLAIDSEKLSCPYDNDATAFLIGLHKSMGLSLRESNRALEILSDLLAIWNYPFKVEMILMMPLIVLHIRSELESFRRLEEADQTIVEMVFKGVWNPTGTFELFKTKDTADMRLLLISLLQLARMPLATIVAEGHRQIGPAWAQSRFRQEIEDRALVGYDGPLDSVIRKYPELVRTASRFSFDQVLRVQSIERPDTLSTYEHQGAG